MTGERWLDIEEQRLKLQLADLQMRFQREADPIFKRLAEIERVRHPKVYVWASLGLSPDLVHGARERDKR